MTTRRQILSHHFRHLQNSAFRGFDRQQNTILTRACNSVSVVPCSFTAFDIIAAIATILAPRVAVAVARRNLNTPLSSSLSTRTNLLNFRCSKPLHESWTAEHGSVSEFRERISCDAIAKHYTRKRIFIHPYFELCFRCALCIALRSYSRVCFIAW